MNFDGNGGGSPVYEPNSFGGAVQDPSVKEPPLKISGAADRYDHWAGNADYYTQPGDLYRLMSAEAQARLVANLVGAMKPVPEAIQVRQIRHFIKADRALGTGIAQGLGVNMDKVNSVE